MGQNIQSLIDGVKKEYAPDKRVAIFNVSFELANEDIILTGEVSDYKFKELLFDRLTKETNYKLIDSIEVLPSKKLGRKIYGIVNLSVCNIRSKPDHPEELSTQALMGTPVKIFKYENGWYLIQTPDDYLGWVDSDGIESKSAEEMIEYIKSKKIIFSSLYGFIYANEDFSEVISDAVIGNIFKYLGKTENAYRVEFPDGRHGYVKLDDAKEFDKWLNELTIAPESIIETGKKLIGFPYLWGGTSIKGVDCSGFIKTIHFVNGLILPRDANQQALIGREIEFDYEFTNLLPGDLIYFGRKASEKRPERITHVALYLGNKRILHSSGRVRMDSFDKNDPDYNEFRLNTIVRIKRILDDRNLIENLKINNNKFFNIEFYQ